jgi:hypothetical protein
LLAHALDDLGVSKAHISQEIVSEVMGDPEDIARLNQGLAPIPRAFTSRIG